MKDNNILIWYFADDKKVKASFEADDTEFCIIPHESKLALTLNKSSVDKLEMLEDNILKFTLSDGKTIYIESKKSEDIYSCFDVYFNNKIDENSLNINSSTDLSLCNSLNSIGLSISIVYYITAGLTFIFACINASKVSNLSNESAFLVVFDGLVNSLNYVFIGIIIYIVLKSISRILYNTYKIRQKIK